MSVKDLIILVRTADTPSAGSQSGILRHTPVLLKAGSIQSASTVAFSTGNYNAFSYPRGDSGIVTITILPFEE